jgi:peptidyl-tRNA hydrolase
MMLSVPTHVVRDAGRTEIDPGTRTVLVVAGPDYAVNQVTGNLHLLK